MSRKYERAEVYGAHIHNGDTLPSRHAEEIAQLIAATWGPEERLTQFGYRDEDEIAPTVEGLLFEPTTHTSLILQDGNLAATSFAIPLSQFDPEQAIPEEHVPVEDRERVAYVYVSIIEPNSQDRGLLSGLKDDLYMALYRSGYRYVLQDSAEEDGFAEKGEDYYREYESLVVSTPHTDYGPEIGPERRILVDLEKYVSVLYEKGLLERANFNPPTDRSLPSLVEISNLREQIDPVEEGDS